MPACLPKQVVLYHNFSFYGFRLISQTALLDLLKIFGILAKLATNKTKRDYF